MYTISGPDINNISYHLNHNGKKILYNFLKTNLELYAGNLLPEAKDQPKNGTKSSD